MYFSKIVMEKFSPTSKVNCTGESNALKERPVPSDLLDIQPAGSYLSLSVFVNIHFK